MKRLILCLLLLPSVAFGQALVGSGGATDPTACSQATFATGGTTQNPYLVWTTVALGAVGSDPDEMQTILNGNDTIGVSGGSTGFKHWNLGDDPLDEWEADDASGNGVCTGNAAGRGDINMKFSRTGASSVPFSVTCTVAGQSGTAAAQLDFAIVREPQEATSLASSSARMSLTRVKWPATSTSNSVTTAGTVRLSDGECVGLAGRAFGTSNVDFTLLNATCTVREIGQCAQPIP